MRNPIPEEPADSSGVPPDRVPFSGPTTKVRLDGAAPGQEGWQTPPGAEAADRYRIERELGRGGMGIIYEADDRRFMRTVAMKVLAREMICGDEDPVRFIEEAQITSQLEHSNIVPVHDMGRDAQGNIFYTMKCVKGLTLTDVLNRIRQGDPETIEEFGLGRLLTIFQKTCDAVAFAHSRGVVHRDLKPANIMIGEYGEVQVLDWGLARLMDGDGEPSPSEGPGPARVKVDIPKDLLRADAANAGLQTASGRVLGTPGFMAPEQIRSEGRHADALSDIYSLGAILYSILVLAPPVTGKDIPETLERIVNGEIAPPVAFNPPTGIEAASPPAQSGSVVLAHCPGGRVPSALSDIVMKAMATDPAERYPNVRDLQREIEEYQNGSIWNLVCDETFAGGIPAAPWRAAGGQWNVRDGEGRLHGGEPQVLVFGRPIPGDVRIEYECRLESAYLTDLACFLSAIPGENAQAIPASGYVFKFGGHSNSANVLERADNTLWSVPASPLVRGRRYRIRAERVGPRLRLWVDDVEIFSVADPDPLSGADRTAVGIVGAMTDMRISRIRIWCMGVPWKADVMDIAERHLQKGHYVTAMDLFRETMESLPDARRLTRARKGYEAARNRHGMTMSLDAWRERLQKAWPDANVTIRLDNQGASVDLSDSGIADLEPLRGMPLVALYCRNNRIADLEPLRGMPLTTLNCGGNPIASLEPLRGMPLVTLLCEGCPVDSLAPLRGAPLTMLNCGGGRPRDGLEPLRGTRLTWLCCWRCGLRDLEPLRGMPLTALYGDGNEIADLEPLRGMPLGRLICSGNRIESLEPLRGMPLTTLHCAGNRLRDLRPLQASALNMLSCQCNEIASLDGLERLPLNSLTCGGNLLTSIERFIKKPPARFLFDCDAIPTSELEWIHQTWSRDFRLAGHAADVAALLALRRRDVSALRTLSGEFQGRRYLFIPRFLSWEDARDLCVELGGRLVTIGSREENEYVASRVPGGSWFWMGLFTGEEGHRWVTGEPVAFRNFVDGLRERRPGGKVFCGGMWTAELYDRVRNCFMIEWDS